MGRLRGVVVRRKALSTYENYQHPVCSQTGCLFFGSKLFFDDRGAFLTSYQESDFLFRRMINGSSPLKFVQDNVSWSKKNVVRGLHFQTRKPQGKLVRVLSGSVLDVVLDLKKGSSTYGQFEVFKLDNPEATLYVPPTHAHGFWVLSDCIFSYKCTEEYDAGGESGVNPFDKFFDFPWCSVMEESLIVSPKDRALPIFVG